MASNPVKSLNGKKLSGELLKPIDHGLYMPLDPDSPPNYLAEVSKELRRQRMAKMPALARHLGIDVDALDLSTDDSLDWAILLRAVALDLAAAVIPGFQEKPRGKHPREIIRLGRVTIDALKMRKPGISDFDACREIVKLERPEMASPGRQSELDAEARQMMNRVSADRQGAQKRKRLRVVR